MCKLCYEAKDESVLNEIIHTKRKFVQCACACNDESLTSLKGSRGEVYTLCRKCGHAFYGGGTTKKRIEMPK
jgi:hypothetical protein